MSTTVLRSKEACMEKKERSQAWKDAHKAAMGRPEVSAKKSALAKRPRSQAWKDSISRSRKGKALSQEYKDKLKASWDKLTPEEKAKRAEKWQQAGTQSLTGRPNKGHQEWFASLSEEERDAFLRPWIEAGQKGRGSYEPSRPEAMVAADLQAKGLYVIPQWYIGKYRVDFWLPDQNAVVEVYGCFWHQCEKCGHTKGYDGKSMEEIQKADEKRVAYIKSKGYAVAIIWEHDICQFQYLWV